MSSSRIRDSCSRSSRCSSSRSSSSRSNSSRVRGSSSRRSRCSSSRSSSITGDTEVVKAIPKASEPVKTKELDLSSIITTITQTKKEEEEKYPYIELYELNNIPINIQDKYIIATIRSNQLNLEIPQNFFKKNNITNIEYQQINDFLLEYMLSILKGENNNNIILNNDILSNGIIDKILIKKEIINSSNQNKTTTSKKYTKNKIIKYYKLVELTNIRRQKSQSQSGGDNYKYLNKNNLYLSNNNYIKKENNKNEKNIINNNFIKYYLFPVLLFKFLRISLFKHLYKFENDFIIKKILVDSFISLTFIFILFIIGLYNIAFLLFNDLLISFIFIYLYIYYTNNNKRIDTEEEKNKKLNIIYILILIPYFLIRF